MSVEEHIETGPRSRLISRLVRPFGRLKIGTRLVVCFAVLLGLVAVSDAIALWQFSRLSDEVNVLYLVDQKATAVERIHMDIVDYGDTLQNLAKSEDAVGFAQEAQRLSETLRRRTDAARQAILRPGASTRQDPVLLTMLESIESTVPGQTDTLAGLAKARDWRAVHLRLDTQENMFARLSESLAREVGAQVSQQRERVVADTLQTQREIFLVLPLAIVLTLVVAIFLSFVVTETITEPLARLDEAAHALARGDFSRQVPSAGNDELANLGRVFNNSAARVRDYYAALQQSEAKFRSYIENSPIGLFVVTRAGRFADFNRATAQLLGHDAESLRQVKIYEVVPKEQEASLRAFLDLEENARITCEWDLSRRDGSSIPVSLQGVGLGGGLAMGYVFDLTERRQAEGERERLRAQFLQAQKMESVGRLAGGVAHDFNNLLTVINGYAALGLARAGEHDPLRDSLDQILQAGERAAALVQQLLAFSRKQVLKQEVVDVNQVVREIGAMAPRLMGEDVEVITRLAPSLPPVLADRHQIGQVLLNLMVNARDAMPNGGTLAIETGEAVLESEGSSSEGEPRTGRYVCLVVRDDGVGMDAVTRENLFEPFFTTKDPGKGTGLGLATVQGIVLQSGGHIRVESEPGEGSVFRVYLPPISAEQEPGAEPALEISPSTGAEHILVVEDQAAVRNFVASVLRDFGYQVHSVPSADDALLHLSEQPVDLVLTDVVMPQVGGYELAAAARRAHPGLPFLFMSGYSGDRSPATGRMEGVFLAKPFSARQLAAKVREALDHAVPWRPA